jgi:hypothetical protein
MVCFRYIIVNALHEGDKKDDNNDNDNGDDDDDNNNNNNNSAVGIASWYELDGLGIEFRLEQHFPQPSRPAWSPPSLLNNEYLVMPESKSSSVWR